jgi:hypothetical protein
MAPFLWTTKWIYYEHVITESYPSISFNQGAQIAGLSLASLAANQPDNTTQQPPPVQWTQPLLRANNNNNRIYSTARSPKSRWEIPTKKSLAMTKPSRWYETDNIVASSSSKRESLEH